MAAGEERVPCAVLEYTRQSQCGVNHPAALRRALSSVFVDRLTVRQRSQPVAASPSPCGTLDLDPVAGEFLLAGHGDGTTALYDMRAPYARSEKSAQLGPARRCGRNARGRDSICAGEGDDDDGDDVGDDGGDGGRSDDPDFAPDAGRRAGRRRRRDSGRADGDRARQRRRARRVRARRERGESPDRPRHCLVSLSPSLSSVTAVRWYASDTGLFVTGNGDGIVRVWDTNRFEPAAAFDMRSGPVSCIALPPGETDVGSGCGPTTTLVAASFSGLADVRLCDLRTGSVVQSLRGHEGHIGKIRGANSSGGRGGERTSAVEDAEARLVRGVHSVAWSPRYATCLASAGGDGSVRLWDVRMTATCISSLDMHARDTAQGLVGGGVDGFASGSGHSGGGGDDDDAMVATARYGGSVSSQALLERRLTLGRQAHRGPALGVAWSPDGLHIVSRGTDTTRVWDTLHARLTAAHFGRHGGGGRSGAPAGRGHWQPRFTADGKRVLVPNAGSVELRSTSSGGVVTVLEGHFRDVLACAVDLHSPRVFTSGADRRIVMWLPSEAGASEDGPLVHGSWGYSDAALSRNPEVILFDTAAESANSGADPAGGDDDGWGSDWE